MKDLIKKKLYVIQEAASLMIMPRAQIRSLWTSYDTIASHSHHVSVIAYLLCKMEWWTDEDAHKCCAMAVFHDMAEARTWDHDSIAKVYNDCDEWQAIKDQVWYMPWLHDLMKEYEKRDSFHATIAKDADLVAQLYIERNLMWQWNNIAKKRFATDSKTYVDKMKTKSGPLLIEKMKDSFPNERYFDELSHMHDS